MLQESKILSNAIEKYNVLFHALPVKKNWGNTILPFADGS
jgi:hypothetical protein